MGDVNLACPKCHSAMIQGFVVDITHGGANVSMWVEGPPEKVWYGVKAPEEKRIPIGTFRCSACGYLESYARDDLARK